MALHFNLKIAFATELPSGENFDHLEDVDLSILTEGEIGHRQFLGFTLREYEPHGYTTDPFDLPKIDPVLAEKLQRISVEHGFEQPTLWSVGSVS